MSTFLLRRSGFDLTELEPHRFADEGGSMVSPQELIASFPRLIFSMPEMELPSTNETCVAREVSTKRGPIDLLIVTRNADILLVETKLLRNPESHRTVVAQAIDYTKAFTEIEVESLRSTFLNSSYSDSGLVDELFGSDLFCAALDQNITTGNCKVLIVGDKIHPNVLGMVESIQSAPHLSFTFYLVELAPQELDEDRILLTPSVVANTTEVERSVIRLEINYDEKKIRVDSEIPEVKGAGSKPVTTSEEYMQSITKDEFGPLIRKFWKEWEDLGGDIRFGTVGFSCGVTPGTKRIALQFIYPDQIALVSEKWRARFDISDSIYKLYLEDLRRLAPRAYDWLVGNRVQIPFDSISGEELQGILTSSLEAARRLMQEEA